MPIRLAVNALLVFLGAGLIASSVFRVLAGRWRWRRAAEGLWVGSGTILIALAGGLGSKWEAGLTLAGLGAVTWGLVMLVRRERSRVAPPRLQG